MKNQNQKSNNPTNLTIGFISPGWPLSQFPNGIVAYVQAILSGLPINIKAVVFADPVVGIELKNQLIDLSKFKIKRNLLQKTIDWFCSRIKLPFAASMSYKARVIESAEKIYVAMQQLDSPIDILEIEESFGTAMHLVERCKIPIVTRLHGPWAVIGPILNMHKNLDFKTRLFYEGEAIKNSHGLTAPSLDVLEKVRKYYGLSLPNAQVIYNPVQEVSTEKQWQYDLIKKSYILFVGRFDEVKGADLLLNAFHLIAVKHLDIKLIFVGPDKGLNIGGKTLMFNDYVKRFISEGNIKQRIQFLGHSSSDTIAELRKAALVTVICSRYENFPVSLLEALAAGCPTVATAVGGIKEIITDGYNGLLAEPESAESIAEKVLELIENPEMMQVLSKNAIEDSKRRFSPTVIAAQTLDYYQTVLAKYHQ